MRKHKHQNRGRSSEFAPGECNFAGNASEQFDESATKGLEFESFGENETSFGGEAAAGPGGPDPSDKVMPEFREAFADLGRRLQSRAAGTGDEPDVQERILLGKDDRRRISDTSKPPFQAICYLSIVTDRGKTIRGTGWLAGPQLVVTAGHCVYRRDEGQFVRSITVSPGLNASTSQAPPQKVARSASRNPFRTIRKYADPSTAASRIPDYDFGAILLDRPFPGIGYFGYDAYSDGQLDGLVVNVVGYPGERNPPTMWGHALPMLAPSARRLIYQIDTTPGQSGSEVYDFVPGQGDEPDQFVVVGIHNSGANDRPENYAARIIDEVKEIIHNWNRESIA